MQKKTKTNTHKDTYNPTQASTVSHSPQLVGDIKNKAVSAIACLCLKPLIHSFILVHAFFLSVHLSNYPLYNSFLICRLHSTVAEHASTQGACVKSKLLHPCLFLL